MSLRMADKFEKEITNSFIKINSDLPFLRESLEQKNKDCKELLEELRRLESTVNRSINENKRMLELSFILGQFLGKLKLQYEISQLAIIHTTI